MTDKPNRKSAGQPPVSAHPAFPVIVALWFAALLGIGSTVLPLSMFENFTVASGLADSFEAAQPPLGTTARIALALVAAALGAISGILVARKVAAAHAPGPAARRAKRPISAHDELGDGGIDASLDDEFAAPREAFAGRRRALAVNEESAPSEFFASAPLPGQNLDAEDEPLDLLAFEEPVAEEITEFDVEHEPAVDFAQAVPAAEPAPFTRAPEPEFAAPVADRALGELGMVELVERFAIALQRHRERADQDSAVEGGSADHFEERLLPAALRPFGFDEPLSDEADDAEALPDFDFDFAKAMSLDRGPFAAEPQAGEEPAEAEHDAELEEEFEETPQAEYTSLLSMKNPFGQRREPMRTDDFAEDDEAGDEPVVVFPGQAARRATPASDGPARDAAPGFGSADSPRPFDTPLARFEQAATLGRASFAGLSARSPGDSAETERALRDALEKLQKMSGAA